MTERVLSQTVELDLDRCSLFYGESPCISGRRYNPAWDFDFTGTAPSIASTIGTAALTFTRTGAVASRIKPDLTLETLIAANTPRYEFSLSTVRSLGLLVEEARINSVVNTTMTGTVAGSPGTVPTGYSFTTTGGVITRTIVGVGVEDGISYIEVRYQFSAAGSVNLSPTSSTLIVAAPGQRWSHSVYLRVVGGSMTNITGRMAVTGRDAVGVQLEATTQNIAAITTASLISQRFNLERTLNNAGTLRVQGFPQLIAAGAGDVTIRFGLPMTERCVTGGNKTSVIAAGSGARGSELPTMAPGALPAVYAAYAQWIAETDGALVNARVLYYGDGTDAERVMVYINHGAATVRMAVFDGAVQLFDISLGAHLPGQINRVAIRVKAGSYAGSLNGAAAVTNAAATVPTVTQVDYGHQNNGNHLNGYFQRGAHWNADITDAQLAILSAGFIDYANACYNTFRTCTDRVHYARTTQTLRFTGRGMPINKASPAYPHIKKIERSPTKLDPEEGLSIRASTTVVLADAPDSDVALDPYIASRASEAAGTFWRRFIARNLNYTGRAARILQTFFTDGAWGAGTVTEKFIIDSLKGPNGNGEVQLTLKDPGKLLDRSKAPTPNSGKTLAITLAGDLTFSLALGYGAQYDAAGYARLRDEVVQFTRVGDVFTIPATGRGLFGTEAAEHPAGSLVQQCLVIDDELVSDTLQLLYNLAGVDDVDMDLAGLQDEDAVWLGERYRISACITDPEDINKLAKEILQQTQMMAWWSPTEQLHKFKVYAPPSPAVLLEALDEDANVMPGIEPDRLDDKRITMAAIYYGLRGATLNRNEVKNYGSGALDIDLDAESTNEYGDRRPRTIYSRWFDADNDDAMTALVQRVVGRYRDAPEDIKTIRLDPADADVAEGDIRDLTTQYVTEADGAPRTVRVLVTSRKDMGTHIECSARVTTFDRRYGFIAPAGTPNYPNNNGYACVSAASGLMNDGTDGYLTI